MDELIETTVLEEVESIKVEEKGHCITGLINRTIDRIEELQGILEIQEENSEHLTGEVLREKAKSRAKYYRDLVKVNKAVLQYLVKRSKRASYVYI